MKSFIVRLLSLICICVLFCASASAEQVPEDGLYRIGVISNAKMFKVVDCVLRVEDGKMVATMTMSGSGYGYLFLGTGAEADAVSRDTWSPYREDDQGRHVFDLEIPALNTELSVASFSIKYEKWYDRTLVFSTEGITEYVCQMPDGVYEGALISDTQLNGSACILSASDGAMSAEIQVPDTVSALEVDSQRIEVKDGVCTVPFPSMDLRMPVQVCSEQETQSGWMKLSSADLVLHTVGAENGTYSVEVLADSNLLKFNGCVLEVQQDGMVGTLTAANQNFQYLYMGTMSEAMEDEAGWIEGIPDDQGQMTYRLPISTLNNDIPVATYSAKKKMWYDRTIRINSSDLVPMESAAAQDLPENTWIPDAFSFSGGSGKVTITCPEVRLDENGELWATIHFSSSHYTQVKVGDTVYPCTCTEEGSTVSVPAAVNQSMTIVGTTTAMSKPHDIEYVLTIQVDALKSESAQPEIPGLTYESTMDLLYAEGFSVDYFEGGYALIGIKEGGQYLVVPENCPVPEAMDPAIVVLQQPINSVYLAATSAMALFDSLDSLDMIRLVGTKADGWYIENARTAIENGDMLFAGKYSEPDFELLLKESCDLAIESTMIYHKPEIKEMLELVGIPVFVDSSSKEQHPLGRTEWIKLYSVLADKEDEAIEFFNEQAKIIESLEGFENTGKTVGFFYIHSDGSAVIRNTTDYIPRMIDIAGGKYIFEGRALPESKRSSLSITMEEFYDAAVNADYLIYNTTIDEPIHSVEELLQKSALLADFKAVKEGNVWCTGKYMHQATDVVGSLITDIHHMLIGDDSGMTFLYKLD